MPAKKHPLNCIIEFSFYLAVTFTLTTKEQRLASACWENAPSLDPLARVEEGVLYTKDKKIK